MKDILSIFKTKYTVKKKVFVYCTILYISLIFLKHFFKLRLLHKIFIIKPSIGRIFGPDDFRSWPLSADNYRPLAIISVIAIIKIGCDYRQNCEVIIYIIAILLVITLPLSSNYRDYLAIIAIITIFATMVIITISRHLCFNITEKGILDYTIKYGKTMFSNENIMKIWFNIV